jgi:hypothetical protein
MLSETKLVADHAGLSVLLKLSVIDFVLLLMVKLMLSFHHNTLLLVIKTTTVVKVDILIKPGTSSKTKVSQLTNVFHTLLVLVMKVNAQLPVLMDPKSNFTELEMLEDTKLPKMPKSTSLPTDQLKLVLKSMKIS